MSNTYDQHQCLGRSPPFVHCWFGSNNSTLDRYLSFWSIPPATSKICFTKQQSGKLKFCLRPRSHLEILRWCRRASTLLQEGRAESRGSCLLSRTWERGGRKYWIPTCPLYRDSVLMWLGLIPRAALRSLQIHPDNWLHRHQPQKFVKWTLVHLQKMIQIGLCSSTELSIQ